MRPIASILFLTFASVPLLTSAQQAQRVPLAPAARGVDIARLPVNEGAFSLADFRNSSALGNLTSGASSGGSQSSGALTGVGASPVPGPLGPGEVTLTPRDEFVLFAGWAEASTGIWDDIHQGLGGQVEDPFDGLITNDIWDTAVGNIDDDRADELILLKETPGGAQLLVMDREADAYVLTVLADLDTGSITPKDGRLELGDFDGDFRDEIVVSCSNNPLGWSDLDSWLRVYDVRLGGVEAILEYEEFDPHHALRGRAADLDGDGIDDLMVELSSEETNNSCRVRVYRGGSGATALTLASDFTDLQASSDRYGTRIFPGEFDGDAGMEIAYIGFSTPVAPYGSFQRSYRIRLFDYEGDAWNLISEYERIDESECSSAPDWTWDAATFDRYNVGRDELAIVRAVNGGATTLEIFDYDINADEWSLESHTEGPDVYFAPRYRMEAGDGDGNGAEELYFSFGRVNLSFYMGSFGDGVDGTLTLDLLWGSNADGPTSLPVLAVGDFDGDGFGVRFTGQESMVLSDPIPLVVLTAAPTKEGIDQNYGATSTSYSVGSSSTNEVGVKSSTAFSVSQGFSGEALSGLLGASVKGTVSQLLAKNEISSETVFYSQNYVGSHNADFIVFQGNLYRSSQYEVVSAPASYDGPTLFTVDVPLDYNVYKWTVGFYNASVEPEFQIDLAELLPHTIGDPESYRTQAQAAALLDDYVGWSNGGATLGQGGINVASTISLQSASTTSEELESSLSLEAEFTVGASTTGGSFSATSGSLYSVTMSQETSFEGAVGDVQSIPEYIAWQYGFGLVVYQPGRLADPNGNQPVGWEGDAFPLTVVTFWTDPVGSGY